MALRPTTYSPQPFTAYVRFYIGGQLITLDGDGLPQHLQGFTFTRGFNEVGTFQLIVADPTWTKIQDLIYEDPTCSWQFGYEGDGVKSPMFHGRILKATPSFIIDATQVVIEGTTEEIRMSQMRKTRAHPDTSLGETFDRISTYVERILQRAYPDWAYEVQRTKRLLVHDSFSGGMPVDMRFTQQRQTDLQFIRNVLAPKAIRERDDVGGYIFTFDPEQRHFYFGPPKFENGPEREPFIFMRESLSEVISFASEGDSSFLFGTKGGERAAVPFIDLMNRKLEYAYADNDNTPTKARLTPFRSPGHEGIVYTRESHPYMITLPAHNKDVADAMARTAYFRAFWGAVTAKLVIQGDYDTRILPNKVVTVVVLTPTGEVHYSSGNYLVTEITDEIASGSWTTSLELTRDGASVGQELIKGVPNEKPRG